MISGSARPGSFSVIPLRELMLGAAFLGVDCPALLEELGIEPSLLQDRDARVTFAVFDRAWHEAARRSGDPHFGMRIAELVRPGVNDILDYLVSASSTLGEAVGRIQHYHRLMNDAFDVRLERHGGLGYLIAELPPGSGVSHHLPEALLAMLCKRGHQLVQGFALHSVLFSHPAPAVTKVHERVFGCPVRFDQRHCALVVEVEQLDRPVISADPVLCRILELQAEASMARLPDDRSQTARVRAAVVAQLGGGDASLKAIAKQMRLNARTLQRRLSKEGTSHQQILDAVRRELSLRYLANPSIGLCEVAFLLGFSEPSAFHRAFRRWTGKTPSQLRRSLGQPIEP